jgi:hypothetical protein
VEIVGEAQSVTSTPSPWHDRDFVADVAAPARRRSQRLTDLLPPPPPPPPPGHRHCCITHSIPYWLGARKNYLSKLKNSPLANRQTLVTPKILKIWGCERESPLGAGWLRLPLFLAEIVYNYWLLKRHNLYAGAPLLRTLRDPSVTAANLIEELPSTLASPSSVMPVSSLSSANMTPPDTAAPPAPRRGRSAQPKLIRPDDLPELVYVRRRLELFRIILDLIWKRERLKAGVIEAQRELFEAEAAAALAAVPPPPAADTRTPVRRQAPRLAKRLHR